MQTKIFNAKKQEKNRKNEVEGRQSKTVRKFTTFFSEDSLPQSVSVCLDWLSFMVECLLPEPAPDQEPIWLTDNIVLEYQKKGTPMFKYSHVVYIDGEPVANVHTHGRNEAVIKPGTAKVEILNHVLGSTTVLAVKDQVMEACKMMVVKNYSEIHISIDGANHIHEFLNAYIRQNRRINGMPDLQTLGRWDKRNRVKMKGKANVDCKRFNKGTGMFDNFKIGSTRKYVTVYNKTSELQKSHKQYIREMWDRAGLDTSGTVWRVELRMKSGAIKEIKDFDINRIANPHYLLQIFRTQIENFFHFVLIENDTNVSRARYIDLFQFLKIKIPLLDKIPRAIVRGAYKAKMGIHNAYANIKLGYLKKKESLEAALYYITDNVQLYNLDDWYKKKCEQWNLIYIGNRQWQPETYRNQLT